MPKTTWDGMPLGHGGAVETILSRDGFGIDDIRRVVYRPQFDEWDCWEEFESAIGEDAALSLLYPQPWMQYKMASMEERPAIKQRMIDIIEAWRRANAIEWTEEELQQLVEAMK